MTGSGSCRGQIEEMSFMSLMMALPIPLLLRRAPQVNTLGELSNPISWFCRERIGQRQ